MRHVTAGAIVIALLLGSGASIDAKALKDQRRLAGTIHAIRLSEHHLKLDAGPALGYKAFFVDDAVEAHDQGVATDLATLRKGDRVVVTYIELGDLAVPSEIARLE